MAPPQPQRQLQPPPLPSTTPTDIHHRFRQLLRQLVGLTTTTTQQLPPQRRLLLPRLVGCLTAPRLLPTAGATKRWLP